MTPVVPGLIDLVEVGRGGFGIVYRAREERFDREVALKVIREPGVSDEVVARFARECRALGSLSGHPNIVSVYDAGQTGDGDLYLTMEFLPGGSLAQRIAGGGPAAPRDVLDWGTALAGALETAHRGGIVHRDVKPENVLFSSLGQAKLVDFGIARMRTAFETRSGSVSATLNHAAPEIIAGRPATAQADVYSLGSVLFFALTDHAPFDQPNDESLAPLIARIVNAEPPDLREQGVPAELASVLERALAKDPDERYATAAAFGEALQGAAAALGMPVPAMPVSAIAPIPGMADAFSPDREVTPRLGTMHVQRRREELPEAPVTPPRRRRSRRVLVAAAAAVVLAAGGVAVALAATGPGTRPAAKEVPLRLADAVEHGDGLDVRRQYSISDDGSTIGSSVVLTNTGTTTAKFVWFEVVPPELASSLSDVRFSVKPDGAVDGTPIAYWVLTLAPGGEQPLRWTTAFPTHERPSMAYLKRVRLLMATEAANTRAATDAKRAELAKATGASAGAAVPVGPASSAPGTSVLADGGGAGGYVGGGQAPGGVITGGSGTGSSGGTSGGGSAPVAGPAPVGGGTGGGSTGGGGTGGGPGGGGTPPAPNHPPTVSASNQSNNELDSVSRTFSATDPDGDQVTITVRGLPAGLSSSGGTVTGRISSGAVAATSDWRSIASRGFPVTVTATDPSGASASTTITWTVRDTATTMPNYIGKWGCGPSCDGPGYPDVHALTNNVSTCAYDPSGDGSHIYRQSVAAGSVITWGATVTYWYGKNDTSCAHVTRGW